MSEPVARFLHPFEVTHHPNYEPEVQRAILASWASNWSRTAGRPDTQRPPGTRLRR
jgi:hypothetical protein